MLKLTLALGVVVAMLVAESSSQKFILPTYRPPVRRQGPHIILPTYRPPPRRDQIRWAREAGDAPSEEPLDSHKREVRSLDSPSAKRGGGSPRTSSGSRNTGPTHPGYNRRNAREIRLPGHLNPLRPKPIFPRPTFPAPVPRIPILARTARDIQIPGYKKPSHRDVIIPNWNPHVKTNPWNQLGGRRPRSLDEDLVDTDLESHERVAREFHVSGLPRKPTHRDVIIPNWNPHVKTNPWNRLGGRHPRSLDIDEDLVDTDLESHERVARDVHVSGLPRKPTHRDVIIPNWNPHVKNNPWNRLGGRHPRSLDIDEDLVDTDLESHERVARDVQISGLPRKPTHRDVIIPNWNPHIKTNPWNRLGGRHPRSLDLDGDFVDTERARDVHISGHSGREAAVPFGYEDS